MTTSYSAATSHITLHQAADACAGPHVKAELNEPLADQHAHPQQDMGDWANQLHSLQDLVQQKMAELESADQGCAHALSQLAASQQHVQRLEEQLQKAELQIGDTEQQLSDAREQVSAAQSKVSPSSVARLASSSMAMTKFCQKAVHITPYSCTRKLLYPVACCSISRAILHKSLPHACSDPSSGCVCATGAGAPACS